MCGTERVPCRTGGVIISHREPVVCSFASYIKCAVLGVAHGLTVRGVTIVRVTLHRDVELISGGIRYPLDGVQTQPEVGFQVSKPVPILDPSFVEIKGPVKTSLNERPSVVDSIQLTHITIDE